MDPDPYFGRVCRALARPTASVDAGMGASPRLDTPYQIRSSAVKGSERFDCRIIILTPLQPTCPGHHTWFHDRHPRGNSGPSPGSTDSAPAPCRDLATPLGSRNRALTHRQEMDVDESLPETARRGIGRRRLGGRDDRLRIEGRRPPAHDDGDRKRAALWKALEAALPAEGRPIEAYAEDPALTSVLCRSGGRTFLFKLAGPRGTFEEIQQMKALAHQPDHLREGGGWGLLGPLVQRPA